MKSNSATVSAFHTPLLSRLIVPLGLALVVALGATGCGQTKSDAVAKNDATSSDSGKKEVKIEGKTEPLSDEEPEQPAKAQEKTPAKAEEKPPVKAEEKPPTKTAEKAPAEQTESKPTQTAQAGGSPRPAGGNGTETTQPVQFDEESKPVGDSGRVKETLIPGKVYMVIQKFALNVQAIDEDSGSRERIKAGEVVEAIVNRTIESNDGKRIVEVRHVQAFRFVKVLSGAADFNVDLGTPDKILLSALDNIAPNSKGALEKDGMKVVIDSVVKDGAAAIANSPSTKVLVYVHGLTGKKVRMTTIDGMGVQTIEPIDCTLTPSERRYFNDRDPLMDARLLPDFGLKPGREVTIPGTAFQDLMPPSWNPKTSGKVIITRDNDEADGGKTIAIMTIKSPDSVLKMTASGNTNQVYGSFKVGGKLRCDMTNHYVRDAVMDGEIRIESVPKGSPLSKATIVSEPKISLMYYCNRN